MRNQTTEQQPLHPVGIETGSHSMYGVQTRYVHNYVTPELFINVMCSFGTYVYELIHVYVVTLSISDSVVNFEVIE